MKSLNSYISDNINEGFKDTVKKLIGLFKSTEENSEKETKRYRDWDDMLKFVATKDENGQIKSVSLMSISDLQAIMRERIKFKDGWRFEDDDKVKDIAGKAALLQGMIDYAYLNYQGKLSTDPFGEANGEKAYQRACEEFGLDSSKVEAGYIGLPVLGIYPYGWGCARRLNLTISTHPEVSFKTGKPKL